MSRSMRWKLMTVAMIALLGLAAWQLGTRLAPGARAAPYPLTVAMPVQLSAGALYVAEQQQLFAQQGLAVNYQRFLLGKQALQAVLDGDADVAIVADTPFMLAVLHGEKIAALATVYASRKTIAIVGRRASGVTDTSTLAGKRVGTILGTNAEFFLDTMLDVHGVKRDQVTVAGFKPDELSAAFRDGKVDAVTVWNPDLARLEQEFGAQAVTFYGEDLFVYRFVLVAKQAYIDSHGAQLRQLLAAIKQANSVIRQQPEATRAMLGKAIGLAPALLVHAFDPTDYTLVLDQSLLLSLSAQTRWAIAKGLVKPGPAPDHRQYVRSAALDAVAPDANRIIH